MDRIITLVALYLIVIWPLHAQDKSLKLKLKSGQITLESNQTKIYSKVEKEAFTYHDVSYLLLQFEELPDDKQKQLLVNHGFEFLEYIPDNAFVVSIPSSKSFPDWKKHKVRFAGPIDSKFKIGKDLLFFSEIPSYSKTANDKVIINASFFKNTTEKDAMDVLSAFGAEGIKQRQGTKTFEATLPFPAIAKLAEVPAIQSVEAGGRKDEAYNYAGVATHRDNVLNNTLGRNLRGQGVCGGVGDGGFVRPHLDFGTRLININPNTITSFGDHGDHVAGTVGGGGIINPDNAGMAPACSIVTEQTSSIVWSAPFFYNQYKMVVTNNSYGWNIACPTSGTYGSYSSTSRDIDIQLLANPKIMHCFAASNDGNITPCGSYTGGFGTISDGYGNSKNALVVGAVTSDDALAGFSSRGPCGDGRVKPEVVAVGTSVVSTIPTNTYGTKQGTSMATPGVTGSLLLLYQRFRQLNAGQDPDGALIKAITCNTADDVGNANVDYRHGYGRINMLRAVTALEENRYLTGNISQGNTMDYTLTVPAGISQVRVLLYWADKEASSLASPALVNNLNLQVIDPTSTAWNPWVLDPTPAVVNANALAVRGIDNLNNIEQVTISTPVAGNYTMRISGATVPFGPQKFYLTYENLSPSITLTHPFGGEFFTPGTTQTIRWDAFGLTAGTFTLQYSVDEGQNWVNITTNQNIANRRFNWTVPAVASDKMRVRVVQVGGAGLSDGSDNNFTILGTPVVSAQVCDRHVYLTWSAVPNTASYEVYSWNGTAHTLVGTTSGTSYNFSGLVNGQQYWYAVRGQHSSGFFSRRSTSVAATPSASTACPIANDIGIYTLASPVDGRELTSTALSATQTIQVTLKNYGNNNLTLTNVPLNYTINGGPTQTTSFSGTLNSNTLSASIPFPATANLSVPGNYVFNIWADMAGDNNPSNNAISVTVRQLANSSITLPLLEDFEGATAATYVSSAFGIPGITRFDFSGNSANSRLRTNFLPSLEGNSGNRTITMDRSSSGGNVQNSLIYTLNMSAYTTAASLLLDFDFMHHGELANTWERVWARGTDAQSWVQVYDLSANQGNAGTLNKIRGLNIKSLLGAQTIGTSFQLRFGNEPGNTAVSSTLNQGYTFDNIRLSEGGNDLSIISVLNPVQSCGASGLQNLTVRVRNNSSSNLTNIPIRYRLNNASTISTSIPALNAGQTLDFTFPGQINLTGSATYAITTWIDWSGPSPQADLYKLNDTIKNFVVVPTVVSYPYLEGFESGASGWAQSGTNTWSVATPSSTKMLIKNAANGNLCWTTNPFGNYADNANAWVESPCFNLTGLSNPHLSFHLISATEKDYDFVWVEFSANGGAWTKLGLSGQAGTMNWYNRTSNNVWDDIQSPWKGVTCPIPAGAVSVSTKFRIVFTSDGSVNGDGVAFDDFHVYGGASIHNTSGNLMNQTLASNGNNAWKFINNASGHRIIGFYDNQNLGNVSVNIQVNNGFIRDYNGLFLLDRNWVINPTNALTSALPIRFFVRHAEIQTLSSYSGLVKSFQQLGVNKYSGANENFSLLDNITDPGNYLFTKTGTWVPFMDGYYFETSFTSMSEFWMAESGVLGETPLSYQKIVLSGNAQKYENQLNFTLADAEGAKKLELWKSTDGKNFTWHAQLAVAEKGQFSESKMTSFSGGAVFYKLIALTDGDKKIESNVVKLSNSLSSEVQMYPNPAKRKVHFTLGYENEFVELALYNNQGQEVFKSQMQTEQGGFELNLEALRLPKGLYQIQLKMDSSMSRHRLVLE